MPAAGEVVPVKELAFAIVREANLKAAAPKHGLVFDDADGA